MLALAEFGERGCWALSAVTRKGGCMPHMYVDPYAILDVTYLVAAFLFDGHGEDDGEYMIGCVLDLGDAVERVALVYPTQHSMRNARAGGCRRRVDSVEGRAIMAESGRYTRHREIGVGRSLAAPPSHTTWHTGPYQGGSV